MPSLTSAALVATLAFLIPLGLRAVHPRLPEPAAEIVLGAVVGPQLLGWVHLDEPVRVLSVIGQAFLLLWLGSTSTTSTSVDDCSL